MKRAVGYTLLEAMVVVAVAGVLSTLAVSSYDRVQSRAQFSTVTNQLLADLSNARAKARGEEQPIVVVFLASTTNAAPPRYVILQDNKRTFDLTAFTPGTMPTGAKQLADVTFSSQVIAVDTSTTRVRAALPAPFAAVNTKGGISFAKTGYSAPYDLRGTVTFQTDGRATFSDSSSSGSVYLSDAKLSGRTRTIGLVGVTGALRGF